MKGTLIVPVCQRMTGVFDMTLSSLFMHVMIMPPCFTLGLWARAPAGRFLSTIILHLYD